MMAWMTSTVGEFLCSPCLAMTKAKHTWLLKIAMQVLGFSKSRCIKDHLHDSQISSRLPSKSRTLCLISSMNK